MATKNKLIKNPKTGQTIQFLQTSADTNGALLEMESTFSANSTEPPLHYHPLQQERFEIIEGVLTVRIGRTVRDYRAGEVLEIDTNVHHSMWNKSSNITKVNWQIRPALNSEFFFETAFGIAMNRKTNKAGLPSPFQVALLCNRFRNEFRLSKPPYAVQRIVFGLMTPIALTAGYKSVYKEYLD